MTFRLLIFFFNDTATTEIYTLSLHDALPISSCMKRLKKTVCRASSTCWVARKYFCSSRGAASMKGRSEEHTSELQSRQYLVCRLLLEKKKMNLQMKNISSRA